MRAPSLFPRHVLLATAVVGALWSVPFAWTRIAAPPGGAAEWLPVGPLAKDWLQYVALIREPGGPLTLANPYTTEPQLGRMVSIFHSALAIVYRATGASPFWLLELSRIPLLAIFFAVLWRALGQILGDGSARRWGLWLVALSGGLEWLGAAAARALPPPLQSQVSDSLPYTFGWSTFGSAYNPLWLAAFSVLLLTLSRALSPGPARRLDAAAVGAGFAILYALHPYSAVAGAAIVATVIVVTWWLAGAAAARPLAARAIGLLVGGVVIVALNAWQRQDAVFARMSGGFLGPQGASPFWYPLTLGVVGAFALRGYAGWARSEHPWRFAIGGWLLAIALLHGSPVTNGYHFVPYLHLAVCIVAAPAIAAFVERGANAGARRLRIFAVSALAFSSPVWVMAQALSATQSHWVTASEARVLARLSALPPGNVLGAPGVLGKAIPAYGPHRVFAGHWFLTPDLDGRLAFLNAAMSEPLRYSRDLTALAARDRIAYVVAPSETAPLLAAVLSARGVEPLGDWTLLTL